MYSTISSSLFLFFLTFLFHSFPCVSSNPESCDTRFQCGNITAGFPFWGENRPKHCNHLELHCKNNITFLYILHQYFTVLQINQTSNTLTLARENHLGSFCASALNNTILPTEQFELLSTYKRLTVYHCLCRHPPNFIYCTCPHIGSIFYNPKDHYSCDKSFEINVPQSFVPGEKELNLTHLESVLRKGFEVKVKIDEEDCEECSSPTHEGLSTGVKAGIGVAFAMVGAVGLILIVVGLLCVIKCQRKISDHLAQQNLKALIPLKHYSYAQVKTISKSFVEVVGKGGFGTVYKGTLCDGRSVAVKILKDTKGNGEDFINEVASISKTSHVNIVSLLGFCSEGSKRAIIYEYLENGSLDQYISKNASTKMDWMEMYRIALGVARGLEYLHHGCKTRIVHFDIKPQNVLLDDKLCPKVSDFGLAKLCEKKESILSLLHMRGTIGYIAPEVFSRMYGQVSHKSDVYSYGMLVLEMIGAREKTSTENSESNPSSMYFPEWIYREFEKGYIGRLYGNGITCEEEEIAKKMKLVGLWCVQPSPSERPPMNRVVEMMEGNLNALEVPPRPGLQIPASPLVESSTLAEDILIV